jgi:hypothetical protein
VPLSLFLRVAAVVLPLLARRKTETRDGRTVLRVPNLGIFAKPTDEHHLVQSRHCHASYFESTFRFVLYVVDNKFPSGPKSQI